MADNEVRLRWEGEGLRFRGGRSGGPEVTVDGDGQAGPSPMQHLLIAVAGCMGADIVEIMGKSRAPIGGLDVLVEGWRAPQPPRRYTAIQLTFTAQGVAEEDDARLQRALELSRQTYCSVLHSLRPDVELAFRLERR
jgi:putative redox protein